MSRPNFLRRLLRRVTLTEGEQSILLAFFGVAFFGAALALNIVMTLGGQEIMQRSFSAYDYWIVLSGALGGCVGLYMGRNWMGHPGLRGAAFALVGTIWISLFGGSLRCHSAARCLGHSRCLCRCLVHRCWRFSGPAFCSRRITC